MNNKKTKLNKMNYPRIPLLEKFKLSAHKKWPLRTLPTH